MAMIRNTRATSCFAVYLSMPACQPASCAALSIVRQHGLQPILLGGAATPTVLQQPVQSRDSACEICGPHCYPGLHNSSNFIT